jgi:hypothetical protein
VLFGPGHPPDSFVADSTPTGVAAVIDALVEAKDFEFPIDDQTYEKLEQVVTRWRDRALEISRQQPRGADEERDRGPDTGLSI